ncbi:MAG: hypothetical protein A7315_02045 [Candidatus Altiarchaeales archaeon WOR_SM1_79]|nr:MAG: hypothetical protein A7315_02045 [Candidatus Altiarchaeales archaeon WOR_SM1_79]
MKKIVFVSHNIFGYGCLKEILKNSGDVIAVITRKYQPSISDYCDQYNQLCNKYKIPLYEIDDINDARIKVKLKKLDPDFIFVFGWSQIIDKEILGIPKSGCLGTHPSILPRNRGSAAIPWQILNNEKISAVTLFYLEEGLDCGDIVAQEIFEVDNDETADSFYQKVIENGKQIIQKNLHLLLKGETKRTPQNHLLATYLGRRTPEDGVIDWSLDNERIYRLIRAVSKPYPGAYTYYNYKKITILEAELSRQTNYCGTIGSILEKLDDGVLVQTGRGLLKIRRIYVEGEGEFKATDYLKIRRKFGMNYEDEIVYLRKEIENLKREVEELRKKQS